MKIRVKPHDMEAIQWNGNLHEIEYKFPNCIASSIIMSNTLKIKTNIGICDANIGDWIIRYNNGEFGVIDNNSFHENYEEVSE